MYQLEIKTEIDELNSEIENRDDHLLNDFLSKFSEYKAELEKAVSERGDNHEIKWKDLTEILKMSHVFTS